MPAGSSIGLVRDIAAFHAAQQEARVRKADSTAQRLLLSRWKTGFRRSSTGDRGRAAKSVHAGRIGVSDGWIAFQTDLRPEFVRVIILYPGQTDIPFRFLRIAMTLHPRPHCAHSPAGRFH